MLKNFKKYYLIGIGGVGMSSIAIYLLNKGFEVYGYDLKENDLINNLKDNGAKIFFSIKTSSNIGYEFISSSLFFNKHKAYCQGL